MAGAVLELARDQGVKVVVSMYGSGTGVFIAPDLVLTAKHVVEPWFAAPEDEKPGLVVLLPSGALADAEMYDYPHTVGVGHDWAVLKVTSPGEEWDPKGPPAAVSCDLPPIGSMVATYGYALGKPAMPFLGLVVSGDFDTAEWVGYAGPWVHGFLSAMTTVPGTSGGGVYDMEGRLVGIVVGSLVSQGDAFQSVIFPTKYIAAVCGSHDHRMGYNDPNLP
jgi:S1-C subfamily serine protease